jgi:Xaa-Pro aminopeptidase
MFIKQHHAELSFNTIVAFAENGAYIHHKTGDKKLTANSPILIDFGVRFSNYCSDMSRTFFFGKATNEQKDAYQTVLASQEKAIEFIQKKLDKKEAINLSDVDLIARDYMIKKNYDSLPHALGHGIGLEVHESPRLSPASDDIINEGMVFSIEPGIYRLNKFGIRIEDIFAIEENKLVQLTNSSRKLREIYN